MKYPLMLPAAQWNCPRWRGQLGFYEVYFLKANVPEQGFAVWLRYTLLSPRAAPPKAELWGFVFDHRRPERNWGAKQVLPITDTNWRERKLPLRMGDGNALDHSLARGLLSTHETRLHWQLEWTPAPQGVGIFPMRWMYFLPLPRTKYLSPNWDVRFFGSITFGDTLVRLSGAPAQQAHLWGTQYAEEWFWAHCNAFENHSDAVFETLVASVRLGARALRLGMLCLRVGQQFYVLRRWRACRTMQAAGEVGSWEFVAEQDDFRIEGAVTVEPHHLLGACYETPGGDRRYCHNTKVGDLQLRLLTRKGTVWRMEHLLEAHGTCAAEWVCPTQDPRVRLWV